jgi:hypothetical protein
MPDRFKGVSVKTANEADALGARDQAWKKGAAIGAFDTFGRDAERIYLDSSIKKGKPNYVSAEYQDCFGHALLEVLRSPESDQDLMAATAGIREMSDELKGRGIVSAFSFAPSDDVSLATAFTAAGFRKTGLLARGLAWSKDGSERKDAILWTRKLANPGEDEEE